MSFRALVLGALPRSDAVKLTTALLAELTAQLDAHAEVYGRVYQVPVDAISLIPHMHTASIARDRGFKIFSSEVENGMYQKQP